MAPLEFPHVALPQGPAQPVQAVASATAFGAAGSPNTFSFSVQSSLTGSVSDNSSLVAIRMLSFAKSRLCLVLARCSLLCTVSCSKPAPKSRPGCQGAWETAGFRKMVRRILSLMSCLRPGLLWACDALGPLQSLCPGFGLSLSQAFPVSGLLFPLVAPSSFTADCNA